MSVQVRLRHRLDALMLDIDFEAPPGLTALFGRSGAGKTTVINAVAGLFRPDEGRITIDNVTLFDSANGTDVPPWKRRLGYIFQEARLFPHLTVRQNLRYGRWFAGAQTEEGHAIDLLGLASLLHRRPGALSGGEKQRVAIGRALLADPALILADEPLASLDAARKEEILPYFERLRDEAGIPILYVSHAPSEVARLATSVVALQNGTIARQGSAESVLSDPAVTPLGARQAGAMLEAQVVAHHDDGLSSLSAQGVPFIVPHVDAAIGSTLRVRIEANDIIVARDHPKALSALNILPATIRDMRRGDGPGVLLQLDLNPGIVLARITRRSADLLGLSEGVAVYAVIKAVSVSKESLAAKSVLSLK